MELEDTQNSLYKNLVKEEFFSFLFLKDFFADWVLLLPELPPGHLGPLGNIMIPVTHWKLISHNITRFCLFGDWSLRNVRLLLNVW